MQKQAGGDRLLIRFLSISEAHTVVFAFPSPRDQQDKYVITAEFEVRNIIARKSNRSV
jgi:hypothetical protein